MAAVYRVAPKETWAKIGLGLHHDQVMAWAHRSLSLVPNGHALVSSGRTKAAEKLVELGYLVEVERLSPQRWIVVHLTQECWDRLRKDLG